MTTLAEIAGDIDPRYGTGTTKVWFQKTEFFRDGVMGYNWLHRKGMMPTSEGIEKTHTLVGTVDCTDPEEVWVLMQGEKWSPTGKARHLLRTLDLGHTTMCVGDVVQVGKSFYIADSSGFVLL